MIKIKIISNQKKEYDKIFNNIKQEGIYEFHLKIKDDEYVYIDVHVFHSQYDTNINILNGQHYTYTYMPCSSPILTL